MVIDNGSKLTTEVPQSNHEDTTKDIVQVINYTADEATQTVASNIESVITVAENINSIIENTNEFNGKYDELTQNVIYQNNTISGLNLLDKSVSLFSNKILNDISMVASNILSVVNTSSLTNQLNTINSIKENIISLNDYVNDIVRVSNNSKNVQIVASLQEQIFVLNSKSNELQSIYASLEELLTIFNYLNSILVNSEWVKNYITLKTEKGFTDGEYYNMQLALFSNLKQLETIYNNLNDITEISNKLDNYPNIISEIRTELDYLLVNYKQELEDTKNSNKAELLEIVKNFELNTSDLLSQLNKLKLEVSSVLIDTERMKLELEQLKLNTSKELSNIVENTKSKIETIFKDSNSVISKIQLDYEKMKADYQVQKSQFEDYKENIDTYIKASILDFIKVTLEPVFTNPENQEVLIKGLSKLGGVDLANPQSEY